MVQWVACIIVQPAYWFNFLLDKWGTINQESLYQSTHVGNYGVLWLSNIMLRNVPMIYLILT